MEPIYFYARKQKFQSLSNFSPHPIQIIDNHQTRKYQTGEHCFHGEKYILVSQNISHSDRKEELRVYAQKFQEPSNLDSPILAKRAGGKKGLALTAQELKIWDSLNVELQRKICLYKLENYPDIKEELRSTQDKVLIHPALRVSKDKVKHRKWEGRLVEEDGNKKIIGANVLGNIWMELRSQLNL